MKNPKNKIDRKKKKHDVNKKTYEWLRRVSGKNLAWGIMTGVRPTKPMMHLMEEGYSDAEDDVLGLADGLDEAAESAKKAKKFQEKGGHLHHSLIKYYG